MSELCQLAKPFKSNIELYFHTQIKKNRNDNLGDNQVVSLELYIVLC